MQQSQLKGKSTFNLEHLRDLMLTQKTKVFKVGLFVQMGNTLESIDGAVSDNQRGYYPTTEVADFFLKRFLGCKLREAPEITTKRLFQATEDFIRDVISEPEVKARYEIALLAELSSEAKTFAPRSFADRYLRVADRQVYISFLADVEIAPQPFDKDTDLIDTHLKRIQIDFESGIGVLGKPDTSRVPGSGVRGRGSGERETTASSLAGKEESSRKEDNSGQGKDGPAGAIAQGGNGR